MKRWGIVLTVFYAIIVALLLAPARLILVSTDFWSVSHVFWVYDDWATWIWIGILVAGQALLLFLSVDTSWRRIRPRRHLAVTVSLASFFAAVLTIASLFSIMVGVYGDSLPPLWEGKKSLFDSTSLGIWIGLWVIWGGVFYQYYRDSSQALSSVVSWLLKGSILELLIVTLWCAIAATAPRHSQRGSAS